jgi:hypothetical protein
MRYRESRTGIRTGVAKKKKKKTAREKEKGL